MAELKSSDLLEQLVSLGMSRTQAKQVAYGYYYEFEGTLK